MATENDRIYIYNAPYPDEYDEPHVIFKKFKFEYEINNLKNSPGLPGACNVYYFPVLPCSIPNFTIPVRKCRDIGKFEAFVWPRVQYYVDPSPYVTGLDTMLSLLGTAFVTCSVTEDADYKHIARRTPIIPNMHIKDGCDAISNTACLKLKFNGEVEPVWLGDERRGETVGVYLERLPGLPF